MWTNSGHVTVMIISDSGKSPVSIKFSHLTFKIALGVAALALLATIIGIISYGTLLTKSLDRDRLAAEVEQMKRYTTKVDQLEKNLETYRTMLKKMTLLAGIDLDAVGMSMIDSSAVAAGTEPQVNNAEVSDAQPHPLPLGYPVKGYLSRSYQPDDANPRVRHFGIDLAVGVGTPVIATADGVVSFAGWDSTFGWEVILKHADGLETMYGHNDSLLVHAGDVAKFGETIAVSGNTGSSTAPHVHYEIRKDGVAVNPEDYLDKRK